MRKPKAVGLGATLIDDEGRSILYEGCSISQLSTIFGLDNREVSRRINGIAHCGERKGYPIYKIADVAHRLIPPAQQDVSEAIKKMSPKDLPPSLTREYWAAQSARLKYEEDAGDLWRTADVLATLSEIFKTARMSILLMRDLVERRTELSHKQRDIIQELIDGVLDDLSDSLIKRFQHEQRPEPGNWKEPDEDEPL